jgi:cyclopropane fatty-acyl-phospholipid synthase-like methyltransferase
MEKSYKVQSDKVAAYYDKWHEKYKAVYGKTIQAHRPPNDRDLMEYTVKSADLKDGQTILDAGCGNCEPSVYFATKFKIQIEALTISQQQVQEAAKRITENKLENAIHVRQGDYHELDLIYPANSFDKVLFLESLGHAGTPPAVISSAYKVLKPGGEIYIKDFYPKKPSDAGILKKINSIIDNLNHHYSYNTLDLNDTINALRASNFEIVFIKQIDFKNDASIKNDFEEKFGIDLFGEIEEFYFAEWLEIKCVKPTY